MVHTAPAHGVDDYLACKSNGIDISPLTVDERGMFTQNAPAQLVDLKVQAPIDMTLWSQANHRCLMLLPPNK